MTDVLSKRLELSSRLIETKILETKRLAHEINSNLYKQNELKTKLKSAWTHELKKASTKVREETLSNKRAAFDQSVSTLRNLSKNLQQIELAQMSHKTKLQELILKIKVQSKQSELVKDKLYEIDNYKVSNLQNLQEQELVSNKYISSLDKTLLPYNENISLDLVDSSKELPQADISSILAEQTFSSLLQQSPILNNCSQQISAASVTNHEEHSQISEGDHGRAANDSEAFQRDNYNADNSVQIQIDETAQGQTINLEYYPKPGHSIFINASQKENEAIPKIKIEASLDTDRASLIRSLETIEKASNSELIII
jgi:hypothetical protein